MASIEIVNPSGGRRFFESAGNIAARTRFGVEKSLWQSGKDIEAEFRRQVLAKTKTGTIYIRRDRLGRRRRHTASGAGETAANRTGLYRKSSGFIVRGSKELVFGNSADYAGFLELGTSRMKARPGLGNSIDASQRDILRNLTDGMAEAL